MPRHLAANAVPELPPSGRNSSTAQPDTRHPAPDIPHPHLDITQITAPAAVGGLESVVAALARGLARRGHQSRILALLGQDPAERCSHFEPLRDAGVELVEIRLPPRRYREERRRLLAELQHAKGTIAHTHGYHADLVGGPAARAAGRPAVSTVHGFTGGDWKNRLYEWLDCRALRRFEAVVPVSAPIQDRLLQRGVAAERLHLIRNAWSPPEGGEGHTREAARRMLGLPPQARVAGWVGRLTSEKGADLFLAALAQAPASLLASVLGDGPLRGELEAAALGLGLGDRVRWHGVVPGAAALYSAFDLVVLSSRTEGTPIVLLEAMAAGVPIVATAVGGVPDVVGQEHALVVPAERPDLLARAMHETLTDPLAARRRAEAAGRRLREEFALEPWLDRYQALYRGLLRP